MFNQHSFFDRHPLFGCFRACKYKRQSGAVLIISLVMLLLLTLIGTTSMQTTSLEEKMVGNMRDQSIAFQAAESALRAGEAAIANQQTTGLLTFNCDGPGVTTNGLYNSTVVATLAPCPQLPNWQTIDWTDTTKIITYSGGSIRSSYYIEQLDPRPVNCPSLIPGTPMVAQSLPWYRITARGTGNTADAVVWLQSTYRSSCP